MKLLRVYGGLVHVKSDVVGFKSLPAGVVRKFGEEGTGSGVSSSSYGRGSKLRGPSQNNPRTALKRDVNITKLNWLLYFRAGIRTPLSHLCR
ncbi:hypothetical protein AVEN_32047-1 [Araneus ventricosus]|uniref:Uncharacterized protein n=1 Tax=Araneus ventricosus TaxID=182803 RepID=A0A4Y2PZK2_ARAVE|nr:hypothetical protein AVEN_32047-1 [Araneus ventricosus]